MKANRKLLVASNVVAVPVRMQHEQPVVIRMRMRGQPCLDDCIDGASQRKELRVSRGTGVEE